MTLERRHPRFVEMRRLADGSLAFYFCIPKHYRKLGFEIANEPLGTSYEAASGEDGKGGRAATLNALFALVCWRCSPRSLAPGRIAQMVANRLKSLVGAPGLEPGTR